MNFFRNFFKSKLGLGLTLGFLALIAFAFASGDVSSVTNFGGGAASGTVARVGDRDITANELNQAANSAVDRLRQQEPGLTMPTFVSSGGLDEVLGQLIDRTALAEFAQALGIRAGDNLVNSEIRQIPAFYGPQGTFDEATYRQAIRAQGYSDKMVREDLGSGLAIRQLVTAAGLGAAMPEKIVRRYAALFKERREGSIIFLPSAAFAPAAGPTDAQLQRFYASNRARYTRPEQRVLRYATFDASAVANRLEPTEQAITQYYQANAAQYAASEQRSFSQVIASSEAQARSIAQAVAGGASLDAAARAAGLRAAELGPVTRKQLAASTSASVADAAFGAAQNGTAGPVRGPLGWHVLRVGNVTTQPARSLASVRGEIVATLREQNRARAIDALTTQVEEQLADGRSLNDVAQSLGAQVQVTPPVREDGRIATAAGAPAAGIDPAVLPLLPTAFQMEESEPQLAELERGQRFAVFEVGSVSEAAPPPLAQVRDAVASDWRLLQGSIAARSAADAVRARLESGAAPRAALTGPAAAAAQITPVNLTREELARQAQQRVPPPLALLFSMSKGSAKRLQAPGQAGWYIVDLDNVTVGAIDPNDPIVQQARGALATATGEEYVQQLTAAARTQQGVERFPEAIAALRRRLVGEN